MAINKGPIILMTVGTVVAAILFLLIVTGWLPRRLKPIFRKTEPIQDPGMRMVIQFKDVRLTNATLAQKAFGEVERAGAE